jgi:hypothetical protein
LLRIGRTTIALDGETPEPSRERLDRRWAAREQRPVTSRKRTPTVRDASVQRHARWERGRRPSGRVTRQGRLSIASSTARAVRRSRLARRLDEVGERRALELFDRDAEGNAVGVAEMLDAERYGVSARTVHKLRSDRRWELGAAAVATVRYETAPWVQMQIDFGQKLVPIAGKFVRVYLLVAVLSDSRRLFVKPFLSERQDDWREGIAAAFRHFGGVTRTLLGDNARSLVRLARPRRADDDVSSRVRRLLSRLGSGAASMRSVSNPHQGKDGVGGQVHQAQRFGRPPLRKLRGARSASDAMDAARRRARARHHSRDTQSAFRARPGRRAIHFHESAELRACPAGHAGEAKKRRTAP